MHSTEKDQLTHSETIAEAVQETTLERYSGSGEHRNPVRMMKIEEIVKWDMNFGVTVGPAGYDHRLRCPYCNKRLVLLFYEGGRERTGIRIAYRCESCGAHSTVHFSPPGQRVELPEVTFGERIVVEKPTPVPNEPAERGERERLEQRSGRRERDKNPSRSNPETKGVQKGQATGGQQQRQNGGPMQRGQQRVASSGERPEARSEARTDSRSSRSTDSATRSEGRETGRENVRDRANSRQSSTSGTAERGQQERPRRPQQSPPVAANSNTQELSEVIQEQADRTSTKSRPYQRRRRRPFRPPINSGNSTGNNSGNNPN